jgi:hypothetical protein
MYRLYYLVIVAKLEPVPTRTPNNGFAAVEQAQKLAPIRCGSDNTARLLLMVWLSGCFNHISYESSVVQRCRARPALLGAPVTQGHRWT